MPTSISGTVAVSANLVVRLRNVNMSDRLTASFVRVGYLYP